MTYEKSTLPNGLRVITATMPHTRSAAVQFYIGIGARREPAEVKGVSHFVEHMVFKGTVRRPHPAQISEAIEGVGGALDAATDHEHTNYRALVPSDHFSTALEVLSDMLRCSRFTTDDLRKERAVILEEIAATYDSPGELVDYEFDRLMWGRHPLGTDVAGTPQSVRRIKRDDLVRHVQQHYRPDTIVISVAGNVTHEQVLAEVERLWADLPASNGDQAHVNAMPLSAPTVEPGPRVTAYYKDTEQSNLLMGVPALAYTHPERYTQDVLDSILGGGMSSRLFVAIREDLGLAYAVSSSVKSFSDAGALTIYAAVDNERVPDTVQAVTDELKRIREERVPDSELRKVKEYIKGHTVLSLERSGYVAHWAGWQELMLGRIEDVDDVLGRVESVTAEDVLNLAQRVFTTERLHMAVVGPTKKGAAFRKVLTLD